MTAGSGVTPVDAGQPPVNRWPVYALLSANAISTVGNMLTAITVPWLVLEMTGSAARTGVSAFLRSCHWRSLAHSAERWLTASAFGG